MCADYKTDITFAFEVVEETLLW